MLITYTPNTKNKFAVNIKKRYDTTCNKLKSILFTCNKEQSRYVTVIVNDSNIITWYNGNSKNFIISMNIGGYSPTNFMLGDKALFFMKKP